MRNISLPSSGSMMKISKCPWDKDETLLKTAVPLPNICTDVDEKEQHTSIWTGLVSPSLSAQAKICLHQMPARSKRNPKQSDNKEETLTYLWPKIISNGNGRALKGGGSEGGEGGVGIFQKEESLGRHSRRVKHPNRIGLKEQVEVTLSAVWPQKRDWLQEIWTGCTFTRVIR